MLVKRWHLALGLSTLRTVLVCEAGHGPKRKVAVDLLEISQKREALGLGDGRGGFVCHGGRLWSRWLADWLSVLLCLAFCCLVCRIGGYSSVYVVCPVKVADMKTREEEKT